jgi:SAM-dependent methyltransferase
MLEKARRNLDGLSVGVTVMDGQLLPCPDGSFDAVICQLGLMFFPDPAGGLAEFRRVLCAGGHVAVSVTPTPERSLYGRAGLVIARYLPSRAEVLNRYFAIGDAGQLRALLHGAGFRDVEVKSERREIVFVSFDDYFRGLEQGAGLAGQEYVTLPDEARRAVREELQRSLAASEADGRLVIDMEVLIGGGRR